jgi:maltooligosyltrehalose synthase
LGEAVWGDTWIKLPDDDSVRHYENIYTGQQMAAVPWGNNWALRAADVLAHFPVALLAAGN